MGLAGSCAGGNSTRLGANLFVAAAVRRADWPNSERGSLAAIRNRPRPILPGKRKTDEMRKYERLSVGDNGCRLGARPVRRVPGNIERVSRAIILHPRSGIAFEEPLPSLGACRLDPSSLELANIVRGQCGVELVQGHPHQRRFFQRPFGSRCRPIGRGRIVSCVLCKGARRGRCQPTNCPQQGKKQSIASHTMLFVLRVWSPTWRAWLRVESHLFPGRAIPPWPYLKAACARFRQQSVNRQDGTNLEGKDRRGDDQSAAFCILTGVKRRGQAQEPALPSRAAACISPEGDFLPDAMEAFRMLPW